MGRYIHFTKDFNSFDPSAAEAPSISIECGGLFVYRFPESREDLLTLAAAWGYRDAVEIISDAAVLNEDQPSEEDDIFAEFIIPFSALDDISYYRVDL